MALPSDPQYPYVAPELPDIISAWRQGQKKYSFETFRKSASAYSVSSIAELMSEDHDDFQPNDKVLVRNFLTGVRGGKKDFFYDVNISRQDHDGVLTIDPTHTEDPGDWDAGWGDPIVGHDDNGCWISLRPDFLRVSDFGVVGNGSFDDTNSMQAAIDYSSANDIPVEIEPGKQVLISKNYTDGSSFGHCLIPKEGATIKGHGFFSKIVCNEKFSHAFSWNHGNAVDADNFTVSNLKIEYSNSIVLDDDGGAAFISFGFNSCHNFTAENVVFENVPTQAIQLVNGKGNNAKIHGCRATNLGRAFAVAGDQNHWTVNNNTIKNIGDDAIAFNNTSSYCVATGNTIEGVGLVGGLNGVAFKCHGYYNAFVGNVVEGGQNGFVEFKVAAGSATTIPKNCRVTGNVFREIYATAETSKVGFKLSEGEDIEISDNTIICVDDVGDRYDCFSFGGITSVRIIDNKCVGRIGASVVDSRLQDVTLRGNQYDLSAAYVYLRDFDNVNVHFDLTNENVIHTTDVRNSVTAGPNVGNVGYWKVVNCAFEGFDLSDSSARPFNFGNATGGESFYAQGNEWPTDIEVLYPEISAEAKFNYYEIFGRTNAASDRSFNGNVSVAEDVTAKNIEISNELSLDGTAINKDILFKFAGGRRFLMRWDESESIFAGFIYDENGSFVSRVFSFDQNGDVEFVRDVNIDGALIFRNIGTSDPGVSGQVWSDNGDLKVSSG